MGGPDPKSPLRYAPEGHNTAEKMYLLSNERSEKVVRCLVENRFLKLTFFF